MRLPGPLVEISWRLCIVLRGPSEPLCRPHFFEPIYRPHFLPVWSIPSVARTQTMPETKRQSHTEEKTDRQEASLSAHRVSLRQEAPRFFLDAELQTRKCRFRFDAKYAMRTSIVEKMATI